MLGANSGSTSKGLEWGGAGSWGALTHYTPPWSKHHHSHMIFEATEHVFYLKLGMVLHTKCLLKERVRKRQEERKRGKEKDEREEKQEERKERRM